METPPKTGTVAPSLDSQQPQQLQAHYMPLPLMAKLSDHQHDSGIENCNSSETSNCHTNDHEEDTMTMTTNRYYDDLSISSAEGDGNDLLDGGRVASENELTDYEIVETAEDVACAGSIVAGQSIDQPRKRVIDVKGGAVVTSKEEKQRQNEEIIILESVSSVSSETGSWEAVNPAKSTSVPDAMQPSTIVRADDGAPIRTACFIDASSLLDETEMNVTMPSHPRLNSDRICDSGGGGGGNRMNETELDVAGGASAEPNIITETKTIDYEIRDQFSSGEYVPTPNMMLKNKRGMNNSNNSRSSRSRSSSSSSTATSSHGGSNNDSPPTSGDHDTGDILHKAIEERQKGELVFRNSIPQYSGVLIPDKSASALPPAVTTDACNRSSYPLRNATSDFTSLMEIYQENKRDSGHIKYNYLRTQSENHAEPQSIILPDTPHNSLLHINLRKSMAADAEAAAVMDSNTSLESVDETLSQTPKRSLKYMESAPILSGGVSTSDFSPKQYESPTMRRKLDTCPILSGGYESDEPVQHQKVVPKAQPQSLQSWVIDMSFDGTKSEVEKETDERKSMIGVDEKKIEDLPRNLPEQSQSVPNRNYSGFFVDFSDGNKNTDDRGPGRGDLDHVNDLKSTPQRVSQSLKKPTGFFIDLSTTEESSATSTPKRASETADESGSTSRQVPPVQNSAEEKKNMFSMFIDFGERRPVPKRDSLSFTSRLSECVNKRRELERRSESPTVNRSEGVTPRKSGSMSQVVDPTDVQLRSKPKVINPLDTVKKQHDDQKRHTWNSGQEKSQSKVPLERPNSFAAGDMTNTMSIVDKIPLLKKGSSTSVEGSSIDDMTYSKSDLSTFSNSAQSQSTSSGSTKELNLAIGDGQRRRHRADVKINETFDKSTHSSITDGILSKDQSPTSTGTNTEDVTYQNEPAPHMSHETVVAPQMEAVAIAAAEVKNHNLETIAEDNEKSSPAKMRNRVVAAAGHNHVSDMQAAHTMETLQATIEKQRQLLLDTVNEANETMATTGAAFVRLSDMDKPCQSYELLATTSTTSTRHSNVGGGPEMRRSRQSNSQDALLNVNYHDRNRWTNNMYYSTDNNVVNLASSVENSRSLSRIFPHLSKVFSNSLPGNIGMESVSEMTSMSSDISANSSITSSCNRSADSGDESSIFCRQPRRLGEDLLKMFLHEIGTDVAIDIGARKIMAHKCILRSRCQYFAAILAGGWVQNAGNVIPLPGYSYEAVHFALCHIYSGASHPPAGISLMELAAIADLLGLVGLREVTAYALKINYCHNFHKPCMGCTDGILQVLPVALNHGLDDLYRKCLKWTCKHYMKVWPTRSFASLSSDLRQRCQQQIIAHLCSENVLTTILECEDLLAMMATLRWGSQVENMLHEISDTAQTYISEHFSNLIASDNFLSLGHDQSEHIVTLENLLLRTASTLSPDQACRSYQRITKLNHVLHTKVMMMARRQNSPTDTQLLAAIGVEPEEVEPMDWHESFIRLVDALMSAVEQCLTRQCSRAMRTTAWQRMDLELRKKVQKLACLTDPLFERRQKVNNRTNKQAMNQQTSYSRNQDIQQVRLAIHAHSKRAAQGYIIDQFTNNNNHHHQTAASNQRPRNPMGAKSSNNNARSNNKSHTLPSTQRHLNNEASSHGSSVLAKERRDKGVQAVTGGSSGGVGVVNGLAATKGAGGVGGGVSGVTTSHKLTKSESKSTMPVKRSASTKSVPTFTKPVAASSGPTNAVALKTDIKSRYMEVRRPRGVPLAINSSVGQVKESDGQIMSSSGTSSRTASPMRQLKGRAQLKAGDSHMSMDSLMMSPKKQLKVPRHLQKDELTLSRDSLAESIRSSSMRTDKTVSQESLTVVIRNRGGGDMARQNRYSAGAAQPPPHNLEVNKSMPRSNGGSTSGSTSSAAPGNKLMRNFSDSGVVFRNGHAKGMASSNSTSSNASTRTSFLSKKSREILEKREATLFRSSGSAFGGPVSGSALSGEDDRPQRYSLPINKSSSTSNIPTTRRIFNTTLHLRKTAHLVIPEGQTSTATVVKKRAEPQRTGSFRPTKIPAQQRSFGQNSSRMSTGDGEGGTTTATTKGMKESANVKRELAGRGQQQQHQESHTKQEDEKGRVDGQSAVSPYEASKLVRSSTFSKECSDLNRSIEIE